MSIEKIRAMKGYQAITALTAYDCNIAKLLDEAGVDIVIVGDSLGNVVLGCETTRDVTMQDMVRHTGAVRRGAVTSFIVADLPFQADATPEQALENSHLLIEAGADAVKIEGKPEIAKVIAANRIPVMGHVGLLPQTAEEFKVQGKDRVAAEKIVQEAKALEKAGCFAIVLEAIPASLASTITSLISIPTIGIGAGPYCDGQVLVINDVLGMYEGHTPKFAKRYAALNEDIRAAVKNYIKEVKTGQFPGDQHSYR